ncbi:MAG: hypothetical protein HY033_04230 [Ignavibacteriae bacterium]|nr:hypothetical protein [Ignavibacteria bacterium]MBI3364095.1 hypothetical protein [Ignavibacteriota bacterium]
MDERRWPAGSKVFRYKLDFYYQQALLYVVTLLLYAGIRGTFTFEQLPSLTADPILYIIIAFVLISFVVLVLNRARDRKLIIADDRMIFHNKFHEHEIPIAEIEWLHIGRERRVRTAGRSQVIVFKVKSRRRLFRIRVGRYERARDLMLEIQRIAQRTPKGRRFSFDGV